MTTIHHVIIHELVKKQHKPLQPSNMREEVLPREDANVIKLVHGVLDLYGKKANSAQYGRFADSKSGPFPSYYKNYYDLSAPEQSEFIRFTKETMEELERLVETKAAASGGYILFADIENEYGRTVLIAMLKNKAGLRLSAKLKPEELDHIDLSKLHQAAKINAHKYKKFHDADIEERSKITYLSFVSPSTNQSTAGYFIAALGCTKGTASATATKSILQEVPAFFRDEPQLDKKDALKVKNELITYLNECSYSKPPKRARLSEIEAIARQFFPSDKEGVADELAEKLFARLNGDKNGIPVEFSVNASEVKKVRYHKLESNNWKLEAKKTAIGVKKDAEIMYDGKALIINRLSDEFRNIIEEHLREKGLWPLTD